MKLTQTNRARKARTWTPNKADRFHRHVGRRASDFWGSNYGHGIYPVPGRLIPTSKLRRRGGSR